MAKNMAMSVIHPDTGSSMEYKQLLKDPRFREDWLHSSANEFGRLAQGVGTRMPHGSNTIFFIRKTDIPKGRRATYVKFVCDVRPQKEEKRRPRMCVGGNLVEYPGELSTPTSDITTAKILFNSVVSTKQA